MSDLLSAEERNALQQPYGGKRIASRIVTRAIFPSVSQLDGEGTAALSAGLKSWLEILVRDLGVQLRTPCRYHPPAQQAVAGDQLPLPDEEVFWARIDGLNPSHVRLSLPSAFAAAICERVFGAPLQSTAGRRLSPGEQTLLRDLARSWLLLFGQSWKGLVTRACEPAEEEQIAAEASASHWLRFTAVLACGPVEGGISLSITPQTARRLLGDVSAAGGEPVESKQVGVRLGEVPIELRVVLGQAEFALDELASLQVGDVIALERRSPDPVDILIDDHPFARARAGLSGQRVALELFDLPCEEALNER
jgi:flagellar motor switch/type III secretory pathway protein FliN